MKREKFILVVLVFFFAVNFSETNAQTSKPAQPIALSKDKISPFLEGKTVVAEVDFTGLDADSSEYDDAGKIIREKDVKYFLKNNNVLISADDKFDSAKVERAIIFLKQLLADIGYLKAEVVALGVALPKNQMKLVFAVKRENQTAVSEIRFVGNVNFSDEELLGEMKACLGDTWFNFDKSHYEYCAQKYIRQILFGRGYFQARVNQLPLRIVADNFVATFEIKEGIRYRYGKIKIEGAKVFSENEFLKIAELKTGEIADGKLLQESFFDTFKKMYADKGYVLFGVEFDPTFIKPQLEGLDGTVDISIWIDEGAPFKLANLNFIGVEKEKADELRNLFSIKAGDVYDQSKIEAGVKRINETGKFYTVDKDQDVEMKMDEETNELYLTVKVRGIKKNKD